ncbi:hypothetical protein GS452_25870 [Rhodococcus hoagii]|nr:hypothetical protein [Prescottella equi]
MRKIGTSVVAALAAAGIAIGGAGTASAELDRSADAVGNARATASPGHLLVEIDSSQTTDTLTCRIYGERVGDPERGIAFDSGTWNYYPEDGISWGFPFFTEGSSGEFDVYWSCWNRNGSPITVWGSDYRVNVHHPKPVIRVNVPRSTVNDPTSVGSIGSLNFGSLGS